MVVPWPCTFMAGAAGSVPIQGTKIPYAMHLGGKIEKKKKGRKEKVRGEKKKMGSEKQR